MRYLIAFVAVVCLAGNAFAATPIRGIAVKGGKNPGDGYMLQKTQPDDPATYDHATNTKGTGSVRMANPNGTSGCPDQKNSLKTRTKSNSTNE